jgi:1,4-alpha-glucan branching enzyme
MTRTAEITHHEAGPIDGSGRERAAEFRVWAPGWSTVYVCYDGTEEGKREAHTRAIDIAARMTRSDPKTP